ncbi:histone-lysine N-methyltransferase [Synchytrium microbalum]|uniref:[histone H3]-lysine(36) N-trimethyltransferase n=1 Tax=Synchytrium microbalum TaxID=1806994 RepID=A0A507C151_9FUNG|nr:histone-lysine N-methyltransferase [Synchytrium microbalum]TPX31295.1 histone-lysine N-methyltransferase [Synchytrium microbalum]
MRETSADVSSLFTRIQENYFLGGANGKHGQEEYMTCSCRYDPVEDSPHRHITLSLVPNSQLTLTRHAVNIPIASTESFLSNAAETVLLESIVKTRDIFLTEKKGHGMRTRQPLTRGQFVIEYVGEVIPTTLFIKRTQDYHDQGKKHFYFMSLKSDEFIDAQKKGNYSRFINHSCVPNCILHKWLVGTKLRIGIFTIKDVPAGTELTFDYKFERYGTKAQPCYCGEEVCKGFIGGTKQSKMIDGLSDQPRLANVDEDDDDDDETVRKSDRALESQEDIVRLIRYLMRMSQNNASKAMKWLRRLEATQSTSQTLTRLFIYYRGLLALKITLSNSLKSEPGLAIQVMKILKAFNFTQKNSVEAVKLDEMVNKVAETAEDQEVMRLALDLSHTWATLETSVKIEKKRIVPPAETAGGVKRAADDVDNDLPSKLSKFGNNKLGRQDKWKNDRKDSKDYDRYSKDYDRRERDRERDRDRDRDRDYKRNYDRKDNNGTRTPRDDDSRSKNSSNDYINDSPHSRPGSQPRPSSLHNNLTSPTTSTHHSTEQEVTDGWSNNNRYAQPPSIPPAYDMGPYGSPLVLPPLPPSLTTFNSAYPIIQPASSWTPSSIHTPWDMRGGSSIATPRIPWMDGGGGLTPALSGVNPDWVPEEVVEEAKEEDVINADAMDVADDSKPAVLDKAAEKALREEVSKVVTKALSKHKGEMTVDQFKHLAKKLTYGAIEKESKKGGPPMKMTEEMKSKIKKFVLSYYERKTKEGGIAISSKGKSSTTTSTTTPAAQ